MSLLAWGGAIPGLLERGSAVWSWGLLTPVVGPEEGKGGYPTQHMLRSQASSRARWGPFPSTVTSQGLRCSY